MNTDREGERKVDVDEGLQDGCSIEREREEEGRGGGGREVCGGVPSLSQNVGNRVDRGREGRREGGHMCLFCVRAHVHFYICIYVRISPGHIFFSCDHIESRHKSLQNDVTDCSI